MTTATATQQQPVEGAPATRYAGFFVRMYATVIDLIALVLLLALLFPGQFSVDMSHLPLETQQEMQQLKEQLEAGTVGGMEFMKRMQEITVQARGGEAAVRAEFLMQTAVMVLYFILSWKYCRPTPGKRLFKLALVDAKTLDPATRAQAVIRFFGYILSSLPAGLGFLWIIFEKKKRAWHDLLAGTVVIHNEPLTPDWQKKRFKRQTILAILLILGFIIYNQIVKQ